MPKVTIIDNTSGAMRTYEDQHPWEYHHEFLWSEGNYGCDCNRHLFFARAAGEDDPEVECGDGRFTVQIVSDDGSILYEDENIPRTNFVNGL